VAGAKGTREGVLASEVQGEKGPCPEGWRPLQSLLLGLRVNEKLLGGFKPCSALSFTCTGWNNVQVQEMFKTKERFALPSISDGQIIK
jgi:hypothetical protein